MKIKTVVPFPVPASTTEEEVQVNPRTAAPSPGLTEASLSASAVALELERRRIQEDSEALQVREENLREYEARLRALQKELDAIRGGTAGGAQNARSTPPFSTRSMAPFSHDDAGLEAAWQKLHRARELTEAEQAHLRDDRLAMRALEANLKEREAAVAEREARVAAQEQLIAAALPRPKQPRAAAKKREPVAGEQTISAFTRLTRAPFLIAESLRGKGDKDADTSTE
jgi:hypothetical protein